MRRTKRLPKSLVILKVCPFIPVLSFRSFHSENLNNAKPLRFKGFPVRSGGSYLLHGSLDKTFEEIQRRLDSIIAWPEIAPETQGGAYSIDRFLKSVRVTLGRTMAQVQSRATRDPCHLKEAAFESL